MEGRESSSTLGGGALIDITQIPLERLAEFKSPALSRLMDELMARAGQSAEPYDFSSAI
jgi:hypothetical protein